jgi:hypothetical protein
MARGFKNFVYFRTAAYHPQPPAKPLQSKSTRAIPVLYGMIMAEFGFVGV